MSETVDDFAGDLPVLPSDWAYVTLGGLLEPDGLSYGVVQPGSVDSQGIPVLRVKNLRNGRVLTDEVTCVSADIEQKYRRTRLRGGEVLLSVVGSVGETAVASSDIAGWNVARAIGVLRPVSKVSSHWIRLCLTTDLAQRCMRSWRNETVQATLNLRDVRRLPIVMPPEQTREAIAAVLGALDDKIAANERIAKTCDELRTLRFARFLDSGRSEANLRPLSSLAEFVNGRAFTKDATGTGRMVIRIAEINSGPGGSTVYNDIEVSDRHLAKPGDVLFSWSGSLTVARWFRAESIINQHIFKVVPKEDLPNWLVFEFVKSVLTKFQSIAAGKATTMGHIQRHHLDELVVAPVGESVGHLGRDLGPLWYRALAAEKESLALADLHQLLLPRLMSGVVRVRDAEKVVEEVL